MHKFTWMSRWNHFSARTCLINSPLSRRHSNPTQNESEEIWEISEFDHHHHRLLARSLTLHLWSIHICILIKAKHKKKTIQKKTFRSRPQTRRPWLCHDNFVALQSWARERDEAESDFWLFLQRANVIDTVTHIFLSLRRRRSPFAVNTSTWAPSVNVNIMEMLQSQTVI